MKKFFSILTVCVITLCLFPIQRVYGEDVKIADYSISPILPNNQIDRSKGFYDLRVSPGQEQDIQLQINNYSNKEQTYKITVNTAQTNGNVLIDYSNEKIPSNDVNKMPISTFFDYPKSVKVPSKKTRIVTFKMKIPNKKWNGILVGGIQIKKDFVEERKKNSKKAFLSEYAYVLGLELSQNDTEVNPDLKYVGVSPKSISNNAGVVTTLNNPTNMYIKGVQLTVQIFKENTAKPVITREIKDGSIAPSSLVDLQIFNGSPGNTKPLEAGKYRIEINIKDQTEHQWNFSDKFEITKEEAKAINRKVFVLKEEHNTLLYIIITVLLFILLISFLLKIKK